MEDSADWIMPTEGNQEETRTDRKEDNQEGKYRGGAPQSKSEREMTLLVTLGKIVSEFAEAEKEQPKANAGWTTGRDASASSKQRSASRMSRRSRERSAMADFGEPEEGILDILAS